MEHVYVWYFIQKAVEHVRYFLCFIFLLSAYYIYVLCCLCKLLNNKLLFTINADVICIHCHNLRYAELKAHDAQTQHLYHLVLKMW